MQIQLTPQLHEALLARLKLEFAETSVANFALDIVSTAQAKQITDLTDQNEALATKNRELMATVEDLRSKIPKKVK